MKLQQVITNEEVVFEPPLNLEVLFKESTMYKQMFQQFAKDVLQDRISRFEAEIDRTHKTKDKKEYLNMLYKERISMIYQLEYLGGEYTPPARTRKYRNPFLTKNPIIKTE